MPLDISGLQFFMPVFSFLFVLIIIFVLLGLTKVLGENKWLHLLISFIVSVIFFSFSSAELYVREIIPWFVVLVVVVFLILMIAGFTKNAKAALAISYVVYFPMLFLSGATIPIDFMPSAVITISKFLPLTYGVQLLKGLWFGGSFSDYFLEVGVLSAIFLVFTALAMKTFKWE